MVRGVVVRRARVVPGAVPAVTVVGDVLVRADGGRRPEEGQPRAEGQRVLGPVGRG